MDANTQRLGTIALYQAMTRLREACLDIAALAAMPGFVIPPEIADIVEAVHGVNAAAVKAAEKFAALNLPITATNAEIDAAYAKSKG